MLHRITLRLACPPGVRLRPAAGYNIYAFLLRVLREVNPELSLRAHQERPKRLAVALLGGAGTPMVRIGLADDEYARALITWLLSEERHLDLIRVKIPIVELQYEQVSAQDLAKGDPPGLFRLQFLTPTQFTIRGKEYPYLLPDPMRILYSLAELWRAIIDPSFDIEKFMEEASKHVFLCHVRRLRTIRFTVAKDDGSRIPLAGFVGECDYVVKDADEHFARTLHALLRLGEYMNVGNRRSWGMGAMNYIVLRPRNERPANNR